MRDVPELPTVPVGDDPITRMLLGAVDNVGNAVMSSATLDTLRSAISNTGTLLVNAGVVASSTLDNAVTALKDGLNISAPEAPQVAQNVTVQSLEPGRSDLGELTPTVVAAVPIPQEKGGVGGPR